MSSKNNEFPKFKTTDIHGSEVVRGNLVIFAKRSELHTGIFLKENRTSYSVAIATPYSAWRPGHGYKKVKDWRVEQGGSILLIKDPMMLLGAKEIKKALAMIPDLKTGRHLPKNFDEKIAWGIQTQEE